ncbi:MAG: NUDIX domain-containing protein [Bacteroidota bacterium]
MKEIDKLAWIEIQDGKILSTRSHGREKYYIPGGKREVGETDSQALCREIKEELQVDLDPASLAFFGTFQAQADAHDEGILVKMTCYTGSYRGSLSPAAEIAEMQWLTLDDMDRISAVDRLIFSFLAKKGMLG